MYRVLDYEQVMRNNGVYLYGVCIIGCAEGRKQVNLGYCST